MFCYIFGQISKANNFPPLHKFPGRSQFDVTIWEFLKSELHAWAKWWELPAL